jgi:hypothetical protein
MGRRSDWQALAAPAALEEVSLTRVRLTRVSLTR